MLATDYLKRQKRLLAQLDKDAIAILPAAREVFRNGDTHYPYRQNSDFYYMTGFAEPEAVAVFMPDGDEGEYILFNRVRDKSREIWDGPRAGQEGAVKNFGVDKAYPIETFAQALPALLRDRRKIYYDFNVNAEFDQCIIDSITQLKSQVRRGVCAPAEIHSLQALLHEMRLIKSEYELGLMRHAAEASAKAHIRAMRACRPGMKEYQLGAEIVHEFLMRGCSGPAYSSIIGSGGNACILHYIANDAEIRSGDLVLIDAGGEYQNYAADITRTFPANGKFTAEQRQVYELVLQAQKAAIQQAKAGNPWISMQDAIVRILTEGLVDLAILKGSVDTLIENKAYLQFYMHHSGHWLGLDTHDAGQYKVNGQWRALQAGMVLTVEPGLYIAAHPEVEERWWNIGVRIEDDVYISTQGNEILSKDVPKEMHEIEALMADRSPYAG